MNAPARRPQVLDGFEHIRGFWDNSARHWVSHIQPGEYLVSRNDELIATTLGSCIAVCVRDRMGTIGGMNHFMLPGLGPSNGGESGMRYGFFAIEQLLNGVLSRGASRNALEVKIFGGGNIIDSDVGQQNAQFALRFFRVEGIEVAVVDVGEHYGRKLRYHPLTGKALVKRVDRYEMAERDRSVAKTIATKASTAGDVELFV